MPCTQQEIKDRKRQIEEKIEKHKHVIELLKVKQKYLQTLCQHPAAKTYSNYEGGYTKICNDCGYSS